MQQGKYWQFLTLPRYLPVIVVKVEVMFRLYRSSRIFGLK